MMIQKANDISKAIFDLILKAALRGIVGYSRLDETTSQFRYYPYALRSRWTPFSCHSSIHVLCEGAPVVWQDGYYTADGPWKDGDHLFVVMAELRRRVEEAEAAEYERAATERQSAEQKQQALLALAAQTVVDFGRVAQ